MGAAPPTDLDDIMEVREVARQLMRANELNPDPNTSMIVASAALLGLYAARTHGVSQNIQTNMLIANAYANLDDFVDYAGKPPRQPVDEGLHGLSALYRLYQTADGWVFLAAPQEGEWQALSRALGHEEWARDPRFATAASRQRHDHDLTRLIGEALCARTAEEWQQTLAAHDVGCVRADRYLAGQFWDRDDHPFENGFIRMTDHARWGAMWRHGPLAEFSRTPARVGPGCLAGQHTNQLLRDLGYSVEEIEVFHAMGVTRAEAP
jgi:crotonobetainyl-CoA:carnitine CoA-transferase CaiB-like acyl-CoA transferase